MRRYKSYHVSFGLLSSLLPLKLTFPQQRRSPACLSEALPACVHTRSPMPHAPQALFAGLFRFRFVILIFRGRYPFAESVERQLNGNKEKVHDDELLVLTLKVKSGIATPQTLPLAGGNRGADEQ